MDVRTLILLFTFTVNALLTGAIADGKWYSFRQLRNPGLNQSSVTSAKDCVIKCLSTPGCSAISYQGSSGACLISTCNNLDLYTNRGWNTYIVGSPFIERKSVLAPQFEWMLTDTCGNSNQGVANGPKFNINPLTYSSSQSLSAGNAMTFGASTSAASDVDTRLHNPLGQTSLTVMMWVKWSSVQTRSTLVEFFSTTNEGLNFYLANGGLWYTVSVGTTGCSGSYCAGTMYSMSVVANVWYHITYAYDGPLGFMKIYVNSTLVSFHSVGNVINQLTWCKVGLIDPSDTHLLGNVYCFKILNTSVESDDVSALAQSCSVGKIRFSG